MSDAGHDVPIGASAPRGFQGVIEDYKILEDEEAAVRDLFSPVEAVDVVCAAIAAYERMMGEKVAEPGS